MFIWVYRIILFYMNLWFCIIITLLQNPVEQKTPSGKGTSSPVKFNGWHSSFFVKQHSKHCSSPKRTITITITITILVTQENSDSILMTSLSYWAGHSYLNGPSRIYDMYKSSKHNNYANDLMSLGPVWLDLPVHEHVSIPTTWQNGTHSILVLVSSWYKQIPLQKTILVYTVQVKHSDKGPSDKGTTSIQRAFPPYKRCTSICNFERQQGTN